MVTRAGRSDRAAVIVCVVALAFLIAALLAIVVRDGPPRSRCVKSVEVGMPTVVPQPEGHFIRMRHCVRWEAIP